MDQYVENEFLFTSESVTEGHPDKVADQISDGVLDAVLAQDPYGRVACETLVNTGLVVVSGEISTSASLDIPDIARSTIADIGYTDAALGFSADSCAVINALDKQSSDIAQGVDRALEARTNGSAEGELDVAGAGDQGMMFGYAANETPELMRLPIALAHRLAERLAAVRKDGTLEYLRPDGKTQVSVRCRDGRPVEIEKLLISTQGDRPRHRPRRCSLGGENRARSRRPGRRRHPRPLHRNTVFPYQRKYEDMPLPAIDLGEGRVKLWLRPQIER